MFKNLKKIILIIFIFLFTFSLASCNLGGNNNGNKDIYETEVPPVNTKNYRTNVKENVDEVVLEELEAGFWFFWNCANSKEGSPGYGLIPDRYNSLTDAPQAIASIASVGFGLSAIPIGIEYGWITKEEGYDRAYKTLETLWNLTTTHGFYYHFVNRFTGIREWNSEVSVIDTAICVNGAFTVGQYFGGEMLKLAHNIYRRVEWNWYYDKAAVKFYMGYTPEKGFTGHWDEYAEQLMVYVLAAGSPTYPVGKEAYNYMKANSKQSGTEPGKYDSFYMTWTGSLFTYQFSHSWLDFRNIRDAQGYDWFENSVNASKASLAYAVSRSDDYKTYSEVSWGATACDGPNGYVGPYGAGPSSGNAHKVDGTIPPCGAIGSIVFTPEASIAAMKNYRTYEKLWCKYGFKDAYNLGEQEGYNNPDINLGSVGWYATDIIGIDKGVSVLMLENYISDFVWNMFMDNKYVQAGLENLGFTEIQ